MFARLSFALSVARDHKTVADAWEIQQQHTCQNSISSLQEKCGHKWRSGASCENSKSIPNDKSEPSRQGTNKDHRFDFGG
jgi:hypothetical protein